MTDDEVREKAVAAYVERDGQRLRGQASARANYRATLSEVFSDVFGEVPEFPEDLDAGKSVDVFGLNLGLSPESKLVAHLHCSKCGQSHSAQLTTLADVGKVYTDPTFIEKLCKGRPKDFEGDLLQVLGDIRDTLNRLVPRPS